MAIQLAQIKRFWLHGVGFVGLTLILCILYRSLDISATRESLPLPIPFDPATPPHSPPTFPEPVGGSHAALNLPYTFNTPDTRYGAYGYNEESEQYDRTRVQWSSVQWADLQNDCLDLNKDRFSRTDKITTARRFTLPGRPKYKELKARQEPTGRTAIVLRAWEGYNYTSLDLYHIRSLIVEAGLQSNADYAVFLLVDVKDQNGTRQIFHDSRAYDRALEEIVPAEFRDIAVFFDLELLEAWYPKISEHSAFFQVYQPLQLFAQLFPGFDHYWQLEMDVKITGHSGKWLDSESQFARKEPRKQSVERSSYYYMPQIHGSYEEFRSAVNQSLQGGGIWGPVRIPDLPTPIGPKPPVADPLFDDFTWGVGEDADLILTNGLADVIATKYWPFKGWVHGFANELDTPRWYSPVAMGRYSWNLLNAMHHAQVHQGLALSSEATAISFALYHGLKVVFPPHPWYHRPQADREVGIEELGQLFNGGTPAENAETNHGLAFGRAMYDPNGVYKLFNGGTWWWVPGYPGRTFKQWMQQDTTDMPSMLREVDGKIWAPMMAMHPVKVGDNA
ncbi:hypothetical protein H2200_000626 [Cladophialophora chaetospira]|uniref:Uncharacterized protein n=1 Tax=Cladophialophora chaetospira TaxID=386627 RepID=A0AA38XP53_9EURO|nr:hypothetical protein H2200_000626 [Cladophialophora chaetospira]